MLLTYFHLQRIASHHTSAYLPPSNLPGMQSDHTDVPGKKYSHKYRLPGGLSGSNILIQVRRSSIPRHYGYTMPSLLSLTRAHIFLVGFACDFLTLKWHYITGRGLIDLSCILNINVLPFSHTNNDVIA